MNQWSRRRKTFIFSIILLFVIVVIGLPAFLFFYRTPTCFDSKQNGDETGVDCGGSCQKLCTAESLPLLLKGDPRVISIRNNEFIAVAVVENPNANAEIYRAGYTLKLYALSTIPLKTIEGDTFVPKGSEFAIFEGPFTLENGMIPTRVSLEWKEDSLVWRKNNSITPNVSVRNINITKEDTMPRIDAIVENLSATSVFNVDLVILVKDSSGNTFQASKTFVDFLEAGRSMPIVFTWPKAFEKTVLGTEVIIRVLPDRSFVR